MKIHETMKNYKLIVEYDGTNYFGWQRQNGSKRVSTVQDCVERAIKRIFGYKVSLIASGRTDTGVHALGQAANFKVNSRLSPLEIRKALNTYLPDDIRIRDVEEVPLAFHSRYGAKRKWYRYTILILDLPSVFDRHYSFHYPYPLNLTLMKKAARLLAGKHDFSGIVPRSGSSGGTVKNKVREIYKLDIKRTEKFIYIDVKGNGFLYKMVRRLVGLLVDTGRGKVTLEDVENILSGNSFRYSIQTAPANGLCLMQVTY